MNIHQLPSIYNQTQIKEAPKLQKTFLNQLREQLMYLNNWAKGKEAHINLQPNGKIKGLQGRVFSFGQNVIILKPHFNIKVY